jgi:hypothetical protein
MLKPCLELTTVLVEDLASTPECDIKGASLTYPDGMVQPMGEHADSGELVSGESRYKYVFVNLGNYGVVAARSTPDCAELEVWGTPEGQARVFEADGDDWPCSEERPDRRIRHAMWIGLGSRGSILT